MPVKDFKKYLELSKVCNKTFGVSSGRKSSTESVILKTVDDEMLSAIFIVLVNYSSEGMWREMRKRWIEDGLKAIQTYLEQIKQEYKTNTGKDLKLEINQHSITDSLEMASYSMYNPKKTGMFRVGCNIKVS